MLIPQQKLTASPAVIIRALFTKTSDLSHLRRYIPVNNLYWLGSGRASLQYILEQIRCNKIGLPSFTCHVVLDAIKRANKTPIFIDSGAVPSFETIEAKINNIDCLILPYNFGFLPELDKITKLCKEHNVTIIEDCAQALGATYKNQFAGSFGDYAFYSFGISKNIGFCGGMIATNKLLHLPKLPNYPAKKLTKVIMESIIAPFFFNKHIYPMFHNALQKELQLKQEALNYTMPDIAKKVVLQLAKRYDKILRIRTDNAKRCMEALDGVIEFVRPIKDTNPSWLYFVLKSKRREELIKKLKNEKVDLQPLFTYVDLSGKGTLATNFENEHLAFALYRKQREIEYIIKKIKKVCIT